MLFFLIFFCFSSTFLISNARNTDACHLHLFLCVFFPPSCFPMREIPMLFFLIYCLLFVFLPLVFQCDKYRCFSFLLYFLFFFLPLVFQCDKYRCYSFLFISFGFFFLPLVFQCEK